MYRRTRRLVYGLFAPEEGGRLGYYTDWAIMLLIAANVGAVMLGTVDPIAAAYGPAFRWFELFSVAAFSVEYVARVWSVVEAPGYDAPFRGRLRFATTPLLLVDLFAILPFYLTALGVAAELRFLRAVRLVRFLRLLKLARYSESLRAFDRVYRDKKPDMILAGFANTLLLVVSSGLMYYAETEAQPEVFSSIPATLWWGVVTLTTVGYGDMAPVTPLGRLLGGVTAVLGIGLFALPASILASGFITEATEGPKRCPHCGKSLEDHQP